MFLFNFFFKIFISFFFFFKFSKLYTIKKFKNWSYFDIISINNISICEWNICINGNKIIKIYVRKRSIVNSHVVHWLFKMSKWLFFVIAYCGTLSTYNPIISKYLSYYYLIYIYIKNSFYDPNIYIYILAVSYLLTKKLDNLNFILFAVLRTYRKKYFFKQNLFSVILWIFNRNIQLFCGICKV